jgi:hypothetical protein
MPGRIILVVAAVCLGAACGRGPGMSRGEAPAAAGPDSVVVDVLNENYYAARIHAVYASGQRHSLGTIAGSGGRSEAVLAWEPRALVFEVLLVTAGATYLTQPVDVAAGESIELRVPSNIAESGFFRRVRRN